MIETKPCRICGGRMKKGLSSVCSYECELKRQQERPVKVTKPRKCAECNKETEVRKKYCSIICSKKAEKRRKRDKKRLTPGYWMDKADTLASKYYRTKTPYCEAKGLDHLICNNELQWCHIVRRGNKGIRYEEYNNLVMCSVHHSYYTPRPEEWMIFIDNNFSDRYELIKENIHNHCDANIEYYQSWINKFNSL